MSEPVIRHDGTAYRCGITTNGIDWTPVGCRHTSPRAAVDHVPTPRSAVASVLDNGPRQSEALDMRPDSALSTPDGRGDRYSPRPVDAHPSMSMSGTLGL